MPRKPLTTGDCVGKYCFALFVSVSFLVCTTVLGCADDILISAAASLTDVLKEMGHAYQAKTRHKLVLTFGSSNFLARQIDEGAPVDVFFSADEAQMDVLEKKRRLEPGTRKNLLSNQLVLIIPSDSHLAIAAPKDLLKPEVKKVALADPAAVPVGVYTRKYLTDERLWDQVMPKVIPVLDVRATLASVESGNVEAGFVYKTDAVIAKRAKVVFEVPIEKGPRIAYPIAIIKDSKKKETARGFLNYCSSAAAKTLFKKYGFVVAD